LIERFAGRIQPPTYYQPRFTAAEQAIIEQETADVADRINALAQPSPA
jgi:hypothetical protein